MMGAGERARSQQDGNRWNGQPDLLQKHPCEQNDITVMKEKFESSVHEFGLEPLGRIPIIYRCGRQREVFRLVAPVLYRRYFFAKEEV